MRSLGWALVQSDGFPYKKREGNSLAGQWLGLRSFTAKRSSLIPGLETKSQKQRSKERKKEREEIRTYKTSRMLGHNGTGGQENVAVCTPEKENSRDTTLSKP